MSDINEVLGNIPMFSRLDKKHLKVISSRIKERTFDEGETIIAQGSEGLGLYVIVSGSANVFVNHQDGSQRQIDEKNPGDFVGELSLLDNYPRTASVVAAEPLTCYVLFKLDFLDALRDEPEISIEILREMGARFRRLMSAL